MRAHDLPGQTLSILMAASVPRRREGGVATVIYHLGRELEARGHAVTYLFQEDLIPPGSVPERFTELVFALRVSRYVLRNREKFSIVNLHAPAGFVYGMRRRWFGARDCPAYVMTLHGLEERRVHVMRREVKKGRAWNYAWKNQMWHRFFHQPRFRWCIKTADAAHANSRDVWAMLQLNYNLDANRTTYIPSGVETRFFIPREYRENVHPRLLYAGTWLDQRGIFYIRDALRQLVTQIPRLTMTFAGCGVPAREIEEFFGEELKGHIDVRPTVPSEKMQELYAEHDIFLFPSLMEGLPTVLLEAMATGLPVITTETCGMPDVVEDEFNGLLIPPGDAAEIVQAVQRLAQSHELRSNLGKAARETMKRYTWERAGSKLESLFLHVLAGEGHPSR